jgi:hypothetical protein
MKPKQLRRRIYVSHEIQGSILKRLANYWVLYHLGMWCIMFTIEFLLTFMAGAPGDRGTTLPTFLATFAKAHWGTLVLPVILFPAILWDMLHLTHQIAGPLVRFGKSLELLAAGRRVEKIKLRQGDILTEFQDAFNEFLDSDRIAHIQSPQIKAESIGLPSRSEISRDVAVVASEL